MNAHARILIETFKNAESFMRRLEDGTKRRYCQESRIDIKQIIKTQVKQASGGFMARRYDQDMFVAISDDRCIVLAHWDSIQNSRTMRMRTSDGSDSRRNAKPEMKVAI
jgi:hypothetical protein